MHVAIQKYITKQIKVVVLLWFIVIITLFVHISEQSLKSTLGCAAFLDAHRHLGKVLMYYSAKAELQLIVTQWPQCGNGGCPGA